MVVNFEMDRLSRTMAWSQQIVNLLARSCESVAVLTERVGQYDPPPNVSVEQIPRWPMGIPRQFGSEWLVNRQAYSFARRHNVDACFVHMAMPWVYLLKPSFRLLNIPVLFWYAHGTVSRSLQQAHDAATAVVTSSSEGFRIPSNKVHVIGQGIDTALFDIQPRQDDPAEILTVSRISERKRIELLISVMDRLRQSSDTSHLKLRIIGTTMNDADQQYEIGLRERVWRSGLQDTVRFEGFVPLSYIPSYYPETFLHINVSQTGSMDKTVLEALAAGCPVLTSNEAFFTLLKAYPEFLIDDERPEAIADRILLIRERYGHADRGRLRSLVAGKHDVDSYVGKTLEILSHLVQEHRGRR